MNQSPSNIKKLRKYEIFVFGSNLAGIHGAGAAKFAYDNSWAEWGRGYGIHFQKTRTVIGSFAIPTKGLDIEEIPLDWIKYYVEHFLIYATHQPKLEFLVTEIGCGLAGYKPEQIAPMFESGANLNNIYLPESFIKVLTL